MEVGFEGDQITMDIPKKGVISQGWRIWPRYQPSVSPDYYNWQPTFQCQSQVPATTHSYIVAEDIISIAFLPALGTITHDFPQYATLTKGQLKSV